MDILDKRIQIQQRALACQSKAMTHMLHRDLHVMGFTGLLRRDAEMTNLHPDLGETRRQEPYALLDIEWITGYRYLCLWTSGGSQDRSQDRLLDTVDKLNCQLQWPGQIGFIIVSLYVLLRAYQLTVIIIFNC